MLFSQKIGNDDAMEKKTQKGAYLVVGLFFTLCKVPPTSAFKQAPPFFSPHSFQAPETQSPTTLNLSPTGFQVLVMVGRWWGEQARKRGEQNEGGRWLVGGRAVGRLKG
jgi:hypothetical protein